ncbi:hypothetical protein ATO8_19799 [Roseivivax marinus]|uniref:Uncharacterized protein n=1 Tax=Roseivivax marinus TaxID=1379903 RepID=W4HFY4_9RHOB|nr:hypothetical protein [Roseivivax marinus]ETW10875.1 hypothetical protein ATO8_19799 [Roseivivax marinus]
MGRQPITAPGAAEPARPTAYPEPELELPEVPEPAEAPEPAPAPKPAKPVSPKRPKARPKAQSPEGMLMEAPRRLEPDVSTGEVVSAGAAQEALEIDYWMRTDRERSAYINEAADLARELGYDFEPVQEGIGPSANVYREQFEDRRMQAILEARQAHPDRFNGVPVTPDEIDRAMNDKLAAEWQDAADTLGAAPQSFLGRTVPEFVGRMGPAATDQVNAPLAVATVGLGASANLGRMMLLEGGLAMLGEAGTLPRQFDMAERLDIEDPNVGAQLALAGTIGAAFPAAVHGAGRVLSYGGRATAATNRELVRQWRKRAPDAMQPAERAAVNAVERDIAARDVGPAERPNEQPAELDRALEDMEAGRPPADDVPTPSAARVEELTTPPRAPSPTIEYELGPARPNPPDEKVLGVVSDAVSNVLGPKARIVVTSGRETDVNGNGRIDPSEQHGSNRHATGHAMDFRVYDSEGNLVTDDETFGAIARRAAEGGAKGIGFGGEYMGGQHMHIDLLEPGAGQDYTWASGANAIEGELEAVIAETSGRTLTDNLGALIRDSEGADYNTPSSYTVVTPPKPLTEMTLDEVDAWQDANQRAGAESTAAGGYQIIRETLQGLRAELELDGSTLFNEETQERLARALFERAGLSRYEAGEISADELANNLAGTWAALPLPDGRSVYAGDGLNAARVDRDTVLGVLGGDPYAAQGRPPPRMSRVPASGVRVDPRTYQFRTEVDESGVGTPLDRVSEWDELLAGDFIIHERFDGGRYIADGHHRKQLSDRLEAQGHSPIEFNAFVLREADGYTVEAVRAIAAVKNIEAGNASAIDAAKVLRVDPAMLEKLSLRNSHARDARGLMRLSDDGFDMVTNRIVREDHAAFVGELTSDGEMQEAILRALVAASPRNMAEARQIARDAQRAGLAAREDGAQGSLFGDAFDVQETLFKERAAVLSKALTQLKNDRKVFRTLVKERDRITEAGNELTQESNAARVDTDETALALIEKLVNRAGPLDDALNAAGRTARGGSVRGGVTEFLATVRSAIEGGDLGRLLDGEPRGATDGRTPDGAADEGAGGRSAQADDDGGAQRGAEGEEGRADDGGLDDAAERQEELDAALGFMFEAEEGLNRNRAAYEDAPVVRDPNTWNEVAETKAPEAIFPEPAGKTRHLGKEVGDQITPEEAAARLEEWKAEAARMGAEEDHSDKVILSLFDHSGEWSKPWEDAGFRVLRYDVESTEFQDLLEFFPTADIQDIWARGLEVYGVLSACPCTTFASSGARWWKTRHDVPSTEQVEKLFGPRMARYFDTPLEANKALKEVTSAIIEFANPSKFHVLENPRGRIRKETGLPPARLVFDPNHFGDPYTKETWLYGEFGDDLPTAHVDPTEGSRMQNKLRGDRDKAARSITPEGFAYSFFMANKPEPRPRSQAPAVRASEATDAGEQTLFDGIDPIRDRDRLDAAGAAPMRGGDAAMDVGLFDTGARDQPDMFAAEAGLGDAFDDPSPTAPAVAGQAEAAENDLRAALAEGLELRVPTGRTIDGEPETLDAAELLEDLDADTDFLGALDVCKA